MVDEQTVIGWRAVVESELNALNEDIDALERAESEARAADPEYAAPRAEERRLRAVVEALEILRVAMRDAERVLA